MNLRQLDLKDAPLMWEWMQDESVVCFMDTDFKEKTLEDCSAFISSGQKDGVNVHRAIVNDNDIYMGTVSLKNIDENEKTAEFAITVRKQAMGKGYSRFAMDEMLKYGFEKLHLDIIYWYVGKENLRAIKFYDKYGYTRMSEEEFNIAIKNIRRGGGQNKDKEYVWYLVRKDIGKTADKVL